MTLLERQPAENARTYAVRVLLSNIINLELAPGSAVSENELSALMNVSRTPVREALIELGKMNLVEIMPQRGSYITKIDYGLIEESRFIRMVLETAVLKLACQEGISDAYMKLLEENLALERQYMESDDIYTQLDLDNHFHKLLYEAVNKKRTYDIIHAQMVHFDRLRTLSLKSIKVKNIRTVDDHENILYSIRRRDAELAEMLLTRHLTRYQVERADLIRLYPDYFVGLD